MSQSITDVIARLFGPPAHQSFETGWLIANRLALLTLAALVTVAAWALVLWGLGISPLVGKSPVTVIRFWLGWSGTAEARQTIVDNLGITLWHALIGFVAGMGVALATAVLFTLYRPAERALMPVAMLLRTFPLVALTPLIVMVFGRGASGVAVIGAIVVFFPTLVTVTIGLRSASPRALDLVRAYGGNRLTGLVKVGLPSAVPAIFASARIAIPGAVTGAMVAEWLATGNGLGSHILRLVHAFRYEELWAATAAITLIVVLIYALVSVAEAMVLGHLSLDSDD